MADTVPTDTAPTGTVPTGPAPAGPAPAGTVPTSSRLPGFTTLPDLASRLLGGSVSAANDELFAERENVIKPEAPEFSATTFGHKGKIMDGWESRRRREPGFDWAVVRLGVPGVVRGVVVDTSFFTGNYPPEISLEAAAIDGYPSADELAAADWTPLVQRSPARGDSRNAYPVDGSPWVTHVRLCQYPDGGVARLRVHGEPLPDPRFLLHGSLDLVALANGGAVTGCSNMHYSSPTNLISPGEPRIMSEGWETARRRDDANDWVEFALSGSGVIAIAELDTRCFIGNAPGWARLTGVDARKTDPASAAEWVELLPRRRLQPDTRHLFRLGAVPEVTHLRLDIYPDGGMARVRLWGQLSVSGREALVLRWFDALPAGFARTLLIHEAGLSESAARATVDERPAGSADRLPARLREALVGGGTGS
jgi:allantoicase